MSLWMRHLHGRKILLTAFWYLVISMTIGQIIGLFTRPYFTDPEFYGLWSTFMNQHGSSADFFILSGIFMYAQGATLAAVFDFIHELFGKKFWAKVVGFTDIMVGLTIIFGFFPMYLYFHVPLGLIGWWLFGSWVTVFSSSIVLANILSR